MLHDSGKLNGQGCNAGKKKQETEDSNYIEPWRRKELVHKMRKETDTYARLKLKILQQADHIAEQDVLRTLQKLHFTNNTAEQSCWPVDGRRQWEFIDTLGATQKQYENFPTFKQERGRERGRKSSI